MITTPILSDEQRAEITFDLLSSSGSRRYTRMASRAAIATGLVDKLCSDEKNEFAATLTLRTHDLLSVIAAGKKRSVHEAELATIIAALILANTSVGGAFYALLHALNKSNLRWVSAMAHELITNELESRKKTDASTSQTQNYEHCDDTITLIADSDTYSVEAANDTYDFAA